MGLAWIAPHEQQLQLARLQHAGRLLGVRPKGELAAGQPIAAKPKALTVVDLDLDRRARAVAEDKQRPTERLGLQLSSAGRGQRVDTGTEVDRLDRHQNPHVRRELNHDALRKALHAPAKAPRPAPCRCTRIVAPTVFCNSTTHS